MILSSGELASVPHMGLHVKKLDPNAVIPTQGHRGDLGLDLYALEDTILHAGAVTKVRTGIACKFPLGFGALLRDRSSVATKQKVFVVAGVIDNQYTGEILVAFYNPGTPLLDRAPMVLFVEPAKRGYILTIDGDVEFKKGDKIAQMILTPVVEMPICEVDVLGQTTRGANGFGSTGR